jgi:hypothetical protein
MLTTISLYLSKMSLLMLYRKLFWVDKFTTRLILLVMVVITLAFIVVNVPLLCVFCTPRRGHPWGGGQCGHLIIWVSIIGAISVVADILIFVIPLSLVVKLHLPKNKKIGLLMVFMTGLL